MRDGFIRKKVQKVVSKTGIQINVSNNSLSIRFGFYSYTAEYNFVNNRQI